MNICARLFAIAASLLASTPALSASGTATIGVNVLLDSAPSSTVLADLGRYGRVRDVVDEIRAVTVQTTADALPSIRALPHVVAASPDAERKGAPVDGASATDFSGGLGTWDLDAVNVTDSGASARTVSFDGTGVYVAVVDTGLVDSWRQYFSEERIATQFGVAFAGGGGEVGTVSSQPNKWEHDQNSHGTHVASTILGYRYGGVSINGVAPKATVIPVKVLNQNGSGWSSVVARGITYVATLKASGLLGSAPVVINMSLGGPSLDAMEKAAVDYAVSSGVLVVASAGNEGEAGMGYPGAYAPVISVAASGWVGEWKGASWWRTKDVADPTVAADFYITDFSSREKAGQDLDVAAPGSWIVGPYQVNSGQTSYYYLGGTSMASPHVAGIVALMAQKFPALQQAQAEQILQSTAIPLPAGCRNIVEPSGATQVCWDDDATGWGLATADGALLGTP